MKAIAEFSTEPQAAIAANMLIDNGINAVVPPNNMGTLYGAGTTWAPFVLYVPEEDANRALQLLREHGDQ